MLRCRARSWCDRSTWRGFVQRTARTLYPRITGGEEREGRPCQRGKEEWRKSETQPAIAEEERETIEEQYKEGAAEYVIL